MEMQGRANCTDKRQRLGPWTVDVVGQGLRNLWVTEMNKRNHTIDICL